MKVLSNDDLLPVAIARLISDLIDYRAILDQQEENQATAGKIDESQLGTRLVRVGLILQEKAHRAE